MSEKSNIQLSKLAPKPGSVKPRTRLGRGIGSGTGKTSGKGHKGQKARAGGSIPAWFEGGAMPLYRRVPKIGFTSIQKVTGENRYNLVNLDILDRHFADGSTVDHEALKAIGYATKNANKAGLKILAKGELTKKLNLKVNAISAEAKQKVEKAGGSVELI